MSGIKLHIFHEWTKWEEYSQTMTIIPGLPYSAEQRGKEFKSVEMWQKRTCKTCGLTQRREVNG